MKSTEAKKAADRLWECSHKRFPAVHPYPAEQATLGRPREREAGWVPGVGMSTVAAQAQPGPARRWYRTRGPKRRALHSKGTMRSGSTRSPVDATESVRLLAPRPGPRRPSGGIIFLLRHCLRWRDLPQELGYGAGVTC